MKRPTLLFPLSLLLLIKSTYAQQYAGASFDNSLPNVPGSEITFWKIADGHGGSASLLNYMITPNGNTQDPSQVKRAVIVIHGNNRDPQTYMSNMLTALSDATNLQSAVNPNSVAVVAPYFPNGDDKNSGYPWDSKTKTSTSSALVWRGSRWANGDNNQYPHAQQTVSSYTVIDQMIQYFDNKSNYPNLNQIVIVGHSLGAQFINRYAAVGANLGTKSPVSYWIGNPNSWLWFNSTRPIPPQSCTNYDDWRNGLSNYTVKYGASLASNRQKVLANYNSRQITMAHGLQDFGDDSSGCAPATTGANRAERFYASLVWFPPTSKVNVDYVAGVGHDAGQMFSSTAGLTRLFLDNFTGNGARHRDFGDRQQRGDSPNPDPKNAAAPSIVGKGAAKMTYQGCWSDAGASRALSYTAYQGRKDATVETCTAACAAAKYKIAGMEYGNECYCDNGLASFSYQMGDTSCSMACSGNSKEKCGNGSRMSIWSAAKPVKYAAPSTLSSTGNFKSMGCYTDSQTKRTLGSKQTSSSTMTIQSCAAFCKGYKYMGTEYGAECYCSNTIAKSGTKAARQADCDMTCTGDKFHYCGAASRLNMYIYSPAKAAATTKKATMTTKKAASTAKATPKVVHVVKTVKKTGRWAFKDCIVYNSKSPVLTTHVKLSGSITPEKCLAGCLSAGLPYCGMGANNQCFGSKKAPKTTSAPKGSGGSTAPVARGCSAACAGNSSVACGGAQRIDYYTYLGSKAANVSPSTYE